MDPRTAASQAPDPDAVAFVRFCYHRRRVGWPELYDEMCAVAARGLYRGYGPDDLAGIGIGFGLFEMSALAALATRVIDEERASRRPVTVVITETVDPTVPVAIPIVPDVALEPSPASVAGGVPVAATVAAVAVDADVEAHGLAAASATEAVPDQPAIAPSRPVVGEPSRPESAIRFIPVPAGA